MGVSKKQRALNNQFIFTDRDYNAILDGLTADFAWVDYVFLQTDSFNDTSELYRLSDELRSFIPELETERSFHNRLDLLQRDFVAHSDRDMFYEQTRRPVILKELESSSSYIVSFRAQINGGELYYQLKFSPDRLESGEITGLVVGLRSVDAEVRKEMEKREEIERTVVKRTQELYEKNRALNRITNNVLGLLGNIVENRDAESGAHVQRVEGFAYILGHRVMTDCPEYALTEEDVKRISQAASLHDVGKISIPDAILFKPARLTAAEFEVMKTHCEKGCMIIDKMRGYWDEDFISTATDICRFHHEKWDGRGYPYGLHGDEIPIAAQIVGVADCFDALTTERPYKAAYPAEMAFSMILNGECGVFSDKLMACFTKCRQQYETHAFNPEILMNALEQNTYRWKNETNVFDGTRILLVDDNEITRNINREILESEGANVREASDGAEAVSEFNKFGPFDMILMDIIMPKMDGIAATKKIRKLEEGTGHATPLVALTASKEDARITEIIQAGANDCVSKPLVISELSKILISCMRQQSQEMERKLEDTVRVANTDPLTHVKSITAYTDKVTELSAQIASKGRLHFGVVLCDINDLKLENDTFGHDSGDIYIKNSCKIICSVFSHSPVFRIGGDEFVVILQGQDYLSAADLMQELRTRSDIASRIPNSFAGKASFSCGLALYDPLRDNSVSDTVKRADEEMYRYKAEYHKDDPQEE